ncbi:MAG: UDP-N-acetylmuramoyl-L-alanyl-D-glutamate--2,6-diaminopimelate ligase [candidate division Zixibacteria bacterium]|nr:UDP-N-acetylmuramoyl-L-alanyl-D-glutamate--2,6-diaminopimelate ligase [candidate division Zixibacteria bacterium]
MIKKLPEINIIGTSDIEIEQIEYDSRTIKKNCLFFAVEGYKNNGYDFVKEAKSNGAVAVMGEREKCDDIDVYIQVPDIRIAMAEVSSSFYNYPAKSLKLCGVTGTNGKTTTCYLLKKILESRGKRVGMVTSNIYDTGEETFSAERTTPESLELQRLFYLMRKNYCNNAVIEISSHALALNRVHGIDFRVAIFTNLTRDHLDFHETMENYLAAKAKLLEKIEGPLSYAVINLDQPEFRQFFGDFSSSYISYSLDNTTADIYCTKYEFSADKTIFDLVTPMGVRTVIFSLPGKFNLINALAAVGGGFASGVDLDNIVKGLEESKPVPGRFNSINQGQPFAVIVDYAHTPDAITRLCEAAKDIAKGRVLLLFGCGGNRDKGKRPLMGQIATTMADFAVVTSDNPRNEDSSDIIKDIEPGLFESRFEIIENRKEAIKTIINMAQPGDVVLLSGKGTENYQEINGERFPFDDTKEAIEVLNELGYKGLSEGN